MGENKETYAYSWIPISTHAEIDALAEVRRIYGGTKRIQRLNLLIVRFTRNGTIGCAKPCFHCMKQLREATYVNIQKVYYSDKSGNIICEKFSALAESNDHYISSGYRYRMKLKQN